MCEVFHQNRISDTESFQRVLQMTEKIPQNLELEMKEMGKLRRKNLLWQLEFMRIHFHWASGYEDEGWEYKDD